MKGLFLALLVVYSLCCMEEHKEHEKHGDEQYEKALSEITDRMQKDPRFMEKLLGAVANITQRSDPAFIKQYEHAAKSLNRVVESRIKQRSPRNLTICCCSSRPREERVGQPPAPLVTPPYSSALEASVVLPPLVSPSKPSLRRQLSILESPIPSVQRNISFSSLLPVADPLRLASREELQAELEAAAESTANLNASFVFPSGEASNPVVVPGVVVTLKRSMSLHAGMTPPPPPATDSDDEEEDLFRQYEQVLGDFEKLGE